MNIKEAEKFVNSFNWKYSRTYPTAPHEYILLEWNESKKQEFIEFAKLIETDGHIEYFYRKPFRNIIIGRYKYWVMSKTPENTKLINRTFVDKDYVNFVKNIVNDVNFNYVRGMSLEDIIKGAF